MKDKKDINIVDAFQSMLDSLGCKPNKIWVEEGSEFYNSPFKKWLKQNHIEIYSTYNEGKSVVAERFIKTLKNKIYKHMKAASRKCFFFDAVNDIFDQSNNTYHRTINMKLIDIKSDSYSKCSVESNEKDPKFQVAGHVRISKYKNIFDKGYAPINFTKYRIKFCLSLHYNDANSYLFVNGTEFIKFKAKDSEILRNISKKFSAGNTKKTGLYGCL